MKEKEALFCSKAAFDKAIVAINEEVLFGNAHLDDKTVFGIVQIYS